MDLVVLGDLLNGFDSLEGLHGYFGFELGIVTATLGFHELWFCRI
jgi:hypothetical protein